MQKTGSGFRRIQYGYLSFFQWSEQYWTSTDYGGVFSWWPKLSFYQCLVSGFPLGKVAFFLNGDPDLYLQKCSGSGTYCTVHKVVDFQRQPVLFTHKVTCTGSLGEIQSQKALSWLSLPFCIVPKACFLNSVRALTCIQWLSYEWARYPIC